MDSCCCVCFNTHILGYLVSASKGITFERKVVNAARAKGLLAARTAASKGVFDVVVIDKENKVIKLIQCKKGWSYKESDLNRVLREFKHLEGMYSVECSVIHEE